MTHTINGAQVAALTEVMHDNCDGGDVTLTFQDDGTLVVRFSFTTAYIDAGGDVEYN